VGSEGVATGRPRGGSVVLPAAVRAEIVSHARAALPNEACGLLLAAAPGSTGHDRSPRFAPVRNAVQSPHRFEMDPLDLLAVLVEADERGETVLAVVHSHVATAAEPSAADLAGVPFADSAQIIVSLAPDRADADTDAPELRAWRMTGTLAQELDLD